MTAPTIIDATSNQTIAEIFKVPAINNMYDSTAVDWDTPPYVRIGNAFASLTISGPDSWGYVVKKFGDMNFTVFSGRHGNIINPVDPSLKLISAEESKGNDAVDPADDRKRGTFGGRVSVIDVRSDEFRTVKGLQAKINSYLGPDKGVILSWCYGLFSFQTSTKVGHGEDVSNPQHSQYKDWQGLATSKICDIVSRDWKPWIKQA